MNAVLLILDKFLFHCHDGAVTYWTERWHQIHAWERSPFNVQVTTNCSTVPLCMPVQITPYSRWHGRHFPYFGPICTAFQDVGKSWDQWKPVIWHEGPIKHFEKALFTILMTYSHETRIFTKTRSKINLKTSVCQGCGDSRSISLFAITLEDQCISLLAV